MPQDSSPPGVAARDQPAPTPELADLFAAFAKMSLSGFGGVLVFARRVIVDQRRWMNAEEFNETYALCHFLPGPNIVNLSVVFGSRIAGIPGAAAAFTGLLGPPVVIVSALGVLYSYYGQIEALQRTLGGISCAAIGMVVGAALRMMGPLALRRDVVAFVVIAATFVAIGILRLPLIPVLLVAIPLSLAITWLTRGRVGA
jgi:chromate transporter